LASVISTYRTTPRKLRGLTYNGHAEKAPQSMTLMKQYGQTDQEVEIKQKLAK